MQTSYGGVTSVGQGQGANSSQMAVQTVLDMQKERTPLAKALRFTGTVSVWIQKWAKQTPNSIALHIICVINTQFGAGAVGRPVFFCLYL